MENIKSRDNAAIKNTGCCSKGPMFNTENLCGSSQLSIIPGNLTPSSGLVSADTRHAWDTCIQVPKKKHSQIVKDRKKENIKQSTQHINVNIQKEAPVSSNQIFIISGSIWGTDMQYLQLIHVFVIISMFPLIQEDNIETTAIK